MQWRPVALLLSAPHLLEAVAGASGVTTPTAANQHASFTTLPDLPCG